jgi:hypothetical protein
MREDLPFAVPEALALPGDSPTVSTASEERGLAHSGHNLPHRRAYVLAAYRAAHQRIESAFPSGADSARAELEATFPDLIVIIDRAERAAQSTAIAYQDGATASPDAFTSALASWERAVLDALTALDSARSSELCIDCGAEVATVKTGLGQRVCGRCLREGTP